MSGIWRWGCGAVGKGGGEAAAHLGEAPHRVDVLARVDAVAGGGAVLVGEGAILVDGINITGEPEFKRAAYLGRVFQDPMTGTAATMGIEENLALAKRRRKTLSPSLYPYLRLSRR